MEKLVLWKANPALLAKDPEERFKQQMTMLEWVKGEIEAEQHKAWGISPNGMSGYALTDMTDEELYMSLAKYTPIIDFKIKNMLSIDECLECNKKLAEAM